MRKQCFYLHYSNEESQRHKYSTVPALESFPRVMQYAQKMIKKWPGTYWSPGKTGLAKRLIPNTQGISKEKCHPFVINFNIQPTLNKSVNFHCGPAEFIL